MARKSVLAALSLAAFTGACLSRPGVQVCESSDDCPSGQVCALPVTKSRGVCAPAADAGAPDAGRSSLHIFDESEQYAVRTNDEESVAETGLASPDLDISGIIGTPDGFGPDVDQFEVPVRLASLVHIRITSDKIRPKFTFSRKSTEPYVNSALAVDGVAERDVFVPEPGTYILKVEDANGGGGIDFRYHVEIREVQPVVRTLEGGSVDRVLTAVGGDPLPIFRMDITRSAVLAVSAQPMDPSQRLNVFLWRYVAPLGVESGQPLGAAGSRVATLIDPGSYRVVVSPSHLTDVPAQISLSTRLVDGSEELEPNDVIERASPFIAPTKGVINSTSAVDVDALCLPRPPGQIVDVEVTSTGPMIPALEARTAGSFLARQPNESSSAVARLGGLLVPPDAPLYFIVSDRRNGSSGGPVGGADFGYTLDVRAVERTPSFIGVLSDGSPMSSQRRLAQAGDRDWSRFVVAGDAALVSIEARSTGAFEPRIGLYADDGYSDYFQNALGLRRRYLAAGEYWVSVADGRGRAGIDFDLEFRRVPLLTEQLINDGRPQDVTIPAFVLGRVSTASDLDDYRFEVPGPTCIRAETLEGVRANQAPPDTRLTVTSSLGAVLAENDEGGEAPGLSRIDAVRVPAGTNRVRVEANTAAAYVLAIEESDACP